MSLQRFILFAFAAFLISIKADGHFPLPDSFTEFNFQLLLLPYTVLFVIVVGRYFHLAKHQRVVEIRPRFLVQVAACICIAFVSMMFLIFLWQEKKYAQFGYHVDRSSLVVLYILSIGLLLHSVFKNQSHGQFLFKAVAIFAACITFSILSFPLHPDRSDMLLLIQAAGEKFLSGGHAYSTYSLPHSVPLTYLPGMWMAYLPAVLMHFDLRFIHAAATILSILVIYTGTTPTQKRIVATLSGVFLVMPYLLYRHEIYMGVLWAALALSFFFEQKGKPIWSSFWIGIACSISQFAWVLLPILFLSIYRRFGWKTASLAFLCCIVAFLATVVPFVLQSPENFYAGVFGHWGKTFNATTLNLSYFIAHIFSIESLKYFQIISVAVICLLAARNGDLPERQYEWMTYVLLFFILLNPLIWVYFYLILFVLMIMDAGRLKGVKGFNYARRA